MNTWNERSSYTDVATHAATAIVGMLVGAGLMYLFDPNRGTLRRHTLRDQTLAKARRAGREISRKADYQYGRAKGVAAEAAGMFRSDHATDRQLRERVRSRLGHSVSNAHSIQVDVSDGVVTLSGDIPAEELECAIHAASQTRSVRDVQNLLQAH